MNAATRQFITLILLFATARAAALPVDGQAGETKPTMPASGDAIFLVEDFVEDERIRGVVSFIAEGNFVGARLNLDELLLTSPETAAAWELDGLLHAQDGALDKARASYERALGINPRQYSARTKLAAIDIQEGRMERAREALSAIVDDDPSSRSAFLLLARISAAEARNEDAFRYYERALAVSPTPWAIVRIEFARLCYRLRQFDKVAEILEPHLLSDQSSATARILMIETQIARNDMPAAHEQIAAFGQQYPEDRRIHLYEGILARIEGRLTDAETHLREGRAAAPASVILVIELARTLVAADKNDEARAVLDSLIPERLSQTSRFNAIALYEHIGDVDRARELARLSVDLAPDSKSAWRQYLALLDAHGETREILAVASEALARFPDEPTLRMYGIRAAMRAEDYAAAEKLLAGGLERAPQNPTYLSNMAAVKASTDDRVAAESLYRRALVVQPDNAIVLNNLASLMLRDAGKIAESLQLATTASTLAPRVVEIQDTLGWAHFLAGNVETADGILTAAAAAKPDDPNIQCHLAFVQSAMTTPDMAETFRDQGRSTCQ